MTTNTQTNEQPAGEQGSREFVQRTNDDYSAWCRTYYQAETLDDRGMASLHGLWAWQEQERRKAAALLEADAQRPALKPLTVWAISSKTFSMLFTSKDAAEKWQLAVGMATPSQYIQPVPVQVVSDEQIEDANGIKEQA